MTRARRDASGDGIDQVLLVGGIRLLQCRENLHQARILAIGQLPMQHGVADRPNQDQRAKHRQRDAKCQPE